MLPIAQASVLRWVLMGGISTNLFLAWSSVLCPGVSTATCVFLCGGCGVVGKAFRGVVCGGCVWRTVGVLRQQDLVQQCMGRLFLCFLLLVLFLHVCVGVVWLMGLLFENYIVDASI